MSIRFSNIFLALIVCLLLLPFIAITVNSFSQEWHGTLLPSQYTLSNIAAILGDQRFLMTLGRSIIAILVTLSLSILIIVPAILVAHIYWPWLDRWMARLVILPYAIPGVVLVVGYLKLFSTQPLAFNGTIWALVLAWIPLCFPMLYVVVKNNLRDIPVKDFIEAGNLLGAADEAIITRVIIPIILPAILLASLLNCGILLSEFVYSNLLAGGRFETLQIYLYSLRHTSGTAGSSVVLIYLLFLMGISLVALKLGQKSNRSKNT